MNANRLTLIKKTRRSANTACALIACLAAIPLTAGATDFISGKLIFQNTGKDGGYFGVKAEDSATMTLLANPHTTPGDPHRWATEADLVAQSELLDGIVIPAVNQTGPITRQSAPQLCLFGISTHLPVMWFESDAADCPQWTHEAEGQISLKSGDKTNWLTYTGRNEGKPELVSEKTDVVIRTDLMAPVSP